MKTSQWLSALLTLTLGLLANSPVRAASQHSIGVLTASQAVAQSAKAKAAGDRKEVESLMARARKAMKDGDLDTADQLIAQAEKFNVEYSVLHLGDTPKKLRAQYNQAKRGGKRGAVERPSQKFAAEESAAGQEAKPRNKPIVTGETTRQVPTATLDPDATPGLPVPDSGGKLGELLAPKQSIPTPDDEAARHAPTRMPAAMRPEAAVAESGPEQMSPLLVARRALAVGDVRRASAAVEAAKQKSAKYGPHDDTPDRVEAAIRDYLQAMELINAQQDNEASRHQLAVLLMDQAQQLVRWKDYDEAERLVQNVQSMKVGYGPFEQKPEAILEKIAAARSGQAGAGAELAAEGKPPVAPYPATQAAYEGNGDGSRVATASAEEDAPLETPDESTTSEAPPAPVTEPVERLPTPQEEPRPIRGGGGASGLQLFRAGEQALQNRDLAKAQQYFREAYTQRDQLDPATAKRLQDHLQMLQAPANPRPGAESLIDDATSQQQLAVKQLSAEVAQKQVAAGKIREKDPRKSLELLNEARAAIDGSKVDQQAKTQLLRRLDRSLEELEKYVIDNKAQIELDTSNKNILGEIQRRREAKLELDDKLAKLVDEFNKLMDEERFAEADVLAKRARELDPENTVVKQLQWQSRFASRTRRNDRLKDDKENGGWEALNNVETAAIPFDDSVPYVMPDAKKWDDLTKSRQRQLAEKGRRRSAKEIEIERKLKTPVSCKFRNRPLSEVLQELAKLADVNMHLDEKGLEEEGVSSDTPVTIDLTQEISLKSALHLILEPKHLSYVIESEVLKITSEQLRDGAVFPVIYNVADLVIPIPNFAPNGRTGLAGALSEAYNMSGGAWGGMGGAGTGYLASRDGTPAEGVVDPRFLAQMDRLGPGGGKPGGNASAQYGPGGMGGGAAPDFDTLIDLITTTVKPQTWDEVGGPGSITQFSNNLSLVISQTQDVHEEIVDLLEQLRKNQDLQVTIEVRFITLSDNFFEQIGVDFQANIVNTAPVDFNQKPVGAIVGLQPPAGAFNFTPSLDIPFRQNSFSLATPTFGTPVDVANFGFAILSDLEAYLLVNASQGDRRTNVLQAPKVTMFNGQQASVFDTTQQPFVISVIPVVGDFAAAYQPVITVLQQGTALTVQAVISADRRFVRLTVVPYFSDIGDVTEFVFSGSSTSTTKKSAEKSTGGTTGDSTASADDATTTNDGITVQLPSLSVVTVSTTVSVPDGGTVLLGGIKRLSEGRNEFGVPILSKLPYINRLFKNVGIGRETQSLMMMVTPRIIIQEEEEERMGVPTQP